MATLIPAIGTSADKLHAELRTLIANSRQRLAGEVNAELTRLYWSVGLRLRRVLQFAVAFPDTEKVASLMRHLSWTHFLQLLPVKTDVARWFYARQSVESRWSVRELHQQIERKAFERTELATLQAHTSVQTEPVVAADTDPAQVFKDPYFLDFLVTTSTSAEASNSPWLRSRAWGKARNMKRPRP